MCARDEEQVGRLGPTESDSYIIETHARIRLAVPEAGFSPVAVRRAAQK